jgi:hypothetical protein
LHSHHAFVRKELRSASPPRRENVQRQSGTPVGELFGVKPTSKSFKTMALDLFTVKNGKLASAHHVENW